MQRTGLIATKKHAHVRNEKLLTKNKFLEAFYKSDTKALLNKRPKKLLVRTFFGLARGAASRVRLRRAPDRNA